MCLILRFIALKYIYCVNWLGQITYIFSKVFFLIYMLHIYMCVITPYIYG